MAENKMAWEAKPYVSDIINRKYNKKQIPIPMLNEPMPSYQPEAMGTLGVDPKTGAVAMDLKDLPAFLAAFDVAKTALEDKKTKKK